jgi:hypothetical protein
MDDEAWGRLRISLRWVTIELDVRLRLRNSNEGKRNFFSVSVVAEVEGLLSVPDSDSSWEADAVVVEQQTRYRKQD